MSAASIERRVHRHRRQGERHRLAVMLQWLAAHAIVHQRGRPVNQELMVDGERAVVRLLDDVADDGHLRYFGIWDAADLGEAPVRLYLTDDARYPYGTTALELVPLVDWIARGGGKGAGWRAPDELTLDDLAPPAVE